MTRPNSLKSYLFSSAFCIRYILAFFLLTPLLAGRAKAQVNEADSLALVALYSSTNGPTDWSSNFNWLTSRIQFWKGVTVTNGRVTKLRLTLNRLSGTLPPEIGDLTELEVLRLGGNRIMGPIPGTIGNLTKLVDLDLGENQFSGGIPSEIGNMVSLTALGLPANRLTGSIPSSLSNLTQLEILDLRTNRLTGTIPAFIADLTELRFLDLSQFDPDNPDNPDTGFTGGVPSSFNNLKKLERFWIGFNSLDEMPDLTGMTALQLGGANDNHFTFEDILPNIGLAGGNFWFGDQASPEIQVDVNQGVTTLSVDVGGTGNTYQWYKDPIDFNNPGSKVIGATDPEFTPSETGNYNCQIANPQAVFTILRSTIAFVVASRIIVNTNQDLPDGNASDGVCDTGSQTGGLTGICTLRAAIQTANVSSDAISNINFNIPGGAIPVISLTSPFPVLSRPVNINGTSQTAGRVEIDGQNAGPGPGLRLETQNSILNGLVVSRFQGNGIEIVGGSGHVVINSRIGVIGGNKQNADGGILISDNAQDVTVGGLEQAEENIIGGGIRIVGSGTKGIRVLRNVLEIPESALSTGSLTVPIDLNGDGPTCSLWTADQPNRPNLEVPSPRVLELTGAFVRGMTRPGATVVAYRVDAMGIQKGRYWARSVSPIGDGTADGSGAFQFNFDFALGAGTQIALTTTDPAGNTSELSQVRRPVVYVPGVGGSWLRGAGGDHLFLPPVGAFDSVIRDRLDRLAMDPGGEANLNGETVRVDGILELPGLYRDVLQHLEAEGYVGNPNNFKSETLDLWRFPYDWRRDPAAVAVDLRSVIDNMTSLTEDVAAACEVDIVTHSNGGMVASAYVWTSRVHSENHINRLLMSAAPYWGTPQVVAAHTRGYLFDFQKDPVFNSGIDLIDLDWGRLTRVFQNLPDGYGLLPSRKYMELIDPGVPLQNDWYLTDLDGRRLHGYDETLAFMTAPKISLTNPGIQGLARNGTMWAQQQSGLHDRIDDWRSYSAPPQIFRHVGRLKLSTATAWRAGSGSIGAADITGSTRRETGDTDRHVAYREVLQPRLGWGDGTVALVSATLGGGITDGGVSVGLSDYSGQGTTWIEPFEYFRCNHLGMVAPACTGDTGNALERMDWILKSNHEVASPPAPKNTEVADRAGSGESEVIYVEADSPIRVTVEDETGAQTGPMDGDTLNKVKYGVTGIGYWASLASAVISVPADRPFTITVRSEDGNTVVRSSRGQSDGDQVRNMFFEDQMLSAGGALRLELTAGGTSPNTTLEVDSDGDGFFEGSVPPGAQMMSTEPGPSVPDPEPFSVRADIKQTDPDPVVSLRIPDVGGPIWNWTLENVPSWAAPDAAAGQNPAIVGMTLAASTLQPGVHRDTMMVALTFDGYTVRSAIPIELVIRDQAAFLANISVQPTRVALATGDSLRFWALGKDQLGLSIALEPTWSATGGTITPSGTFTAGLAAGVFNVTAANTEGTVTGSVEIEIFSGVAAEEEAEIPRVLALQQNYPNPFKSETTIRYDLPMRSDVRLVVYDLLGREVAVLTDGVVDAGRHAVGFRNERVPSGVYFYRLSAAGFQETKKMLLVR